MQISKFQIIAICLAIALAIICFSRFNIDSSSIGGMAENGYVDNGHYFIDNHGVRKEVSEEIWKHNYKLGAFSEAAVLLVLFVFVTYNGFIKKIITIYPEKRKQIRFSDKTLQRLDYFIIFCLGLTLAFSIINHWRILFS